MPGKNQQGLFAGKYQLKKRLGEGGMCEVFEAWHAGLNRAVALKVLRAELAEAHDERQRFLREARTCAQLRHRHIVEIFEVDEAKGRPFIAMELVAGGSLKSLQEQGMTLAHALTLLIQVADALAEAHRNGILHRDLKPENILLTSDGQAKVADWGLAKATEDDSGLTRAGMVLGTPQYISPDQIRQKGVTHSTDLYSFGVILYESVARQLPFRCKSVFEFLQAHLTKEAPRLKRAVPIVPSALDALVAALLSKDPASRPASAADLARELRQILSRLGQTVPTEDTPVQIHESVAAAPIPLRRPVDRERSARQPPQPRRWRTVVACLIVLGSILLLGRGLSVWWQKRRTSQQDEVFRIKALQLSQLDCVTLRFTGPRSGAFELHIEGRPKAIPVNVRYATVLSQQTAALDVRLPYLITKPCSARLGNERFRLDPKPLLDGLFKGLDALQGRALTRALTDLLELRMTVERQRRRAVVSRHHVRRQAMQLLRSHGLDEATVSQLKAALPRLLAGKQQLDAPLVQRLYPLRALAVVFADFPEIDVPWGPIDPLIGIRFIASGRVPRRNLPWRNIAYVELSKSVVIPEGGRRVKRRMWKWLTYPAEYERLQRQESFTAFSSIVMPRVVPHDWEATPRRSGDIAHQCRAEFEITVPADEQWPPQAVALDLRLKCFGRLFALDLQLNDGPTMTLFNTHQYAARTTDALLVNPMYVSFPIHPALIKPGRNALSIAVRHLEPLRWTIDVMALDGLSIARLPAVVQSDTDQR